MALSIYKPGQGKWTRLCSAAGAGALALGAAAWLWEELKDAGENPIYWQATIAVLLIIGVGLLLWWSLNKAKIADFMIATEVEMKKVNWPSRKEVVGSTWIVICGTVMLAGLLLVIDLGFAKTFQSIGILEGAESVEPSPATPDTPAEP